MESPYADSRRTLAHKGKVLVHGKLHSRGKQKRADYVLYHKTNIPLAIVEAKDNTHTLHSGVQQAIEYAELLDVPFAYSSNGDGFIEHDRAKGVERELSLIRAIWSAVRSGALSTIIRCIKAGCAAMAWAVYGFMTFAIFGSVVTVSLSDTHSRPVASLMAAIAHWMVLCGSARLKGSGACGRDNLRSLQRIIFTKLSLSSRAALRMPGIIIDNLALRYGQDRSLK
jgi:hypothetical protein